MTDLLDIEQRLQNAVEALPPQVRPGVLRILTLPDKERADAIGTLYQTGPAVRSLAELLIDLEAEPRAKALVRAELRRLLHEG